MTPRRLVLRTRRGIHLLEPGTRLLVGREDADVLIDDPSVSRKHAAIRVQAGSIRVEDLGSSNGTFVDGARVAGSMLVEPDAAITFGSEATVLDWAEDDEQVLRIAPDAAPATPKTGGPSTLTGIQDPAIEALASIEKPVQGGRWQEGRDAAVRVASTIVHGAGGKRGAEIARRFSRYFLAIGSRISAGDLVPTLLAVHEKNGTVPDDATCNVLERLARDSTGARSALEAFVDRMGAAAKTASDGRRLARLARAAGR